MLHQTTFSHLFPVKLEGQTQMKSFQVTLHTPPFWHSATWWKGGDKTASANPAAQWKRYYSVADMAENLHRSDQSIFIQAGVTEEAWLVGGHTPVACDRQLSSLLHPSWTPFVPFGG